MVRGMYGLTYDERCHALQLFTLQYRRLRADLIYMYKVLRQNRLLNCSSISRWRGIRTHEGIDTSWKFSEQTSSHMSNDCHAER